MRRILVALAFAALLAALAAQNTAASDRPDSRPVLGIRNGLDPQLSSTARRSSTRASGSTRSTTSANRLSGS